MGLQTNILMQHQMLCFEDNELDDDNALIAYKIKKNDIIELKKMINICIKFTDSKTKTMEFEICAHDKLLSIKQMIQSHSHTNYSVNEQILMFNDQLLNNDNQ